MRYPDILVPTEGDGSAFTLVGNGYYRGHRLAEVHYRIAAGLVDIAIFFALWLPAAFLMKFYLNHIEIHLAYQLWLSPWVQVLMVALLPVAVSFFNVVFMQSRTGQSLGKMLFRMLTVSPQVDPMNMAVNYFAAPSGLKLAVRWCFHAADAFLLIGVWFVAFSSRRESLADKACNTMVLRPYDLSAIRLHKGLLGARDR